MKNVDQLLVEINGGLFRGAGANGFFIRSYLTKASL